MRVIEVSRVYQAFVDDDDYERVSKLKWWILKDPNNLYASANIKNGLKWTTVKMHRFIMGALTGEEVDHKDGYGLNNQKGNLRKCTRAENKMNQRKTKNKFGFKGVTFDPRIKSGRPFQARVRSNTQQWSLGFFATAKEAALAYNKAAVEKFGEFANLNQV